MLNIDHTGQAGHHVIAAAGEVDLYTSPELRTALMKVIGKRGCESVAVNLGQVSYMDSSGVATLVEGLKTANKHKVAFSLAAPSDAVMKVLELARLDTVFEVQAAD